MEKLNQDFREFIALLEKHAIEYLIVGGMSLRFIGIAELLKNKQASARDKDLIDVHALKKLHGQGDEIDPPPPRKL